ncbi:MAG: hypothetical protein EOQ62_26365 [Mesorhizobium sp.]|nr:hypothetical protein EJ078_09540 [Mesorhizobium sp. M1A.F.Ca.IN.022.06.1.1]RWG42237.1 MAG: hypothetical protein EOQ62_26365 [Mesorhizobium sp.]TIQ17835.1 MAG: hypothetical protein E5X61_27920 [Mesorhizobium sp.]
MKVIMGYSTATRKPLPTPFDNNDLRMALKLAIDRREVLDTVVRGYGPIGNDFPINASYRLFPKGIEQRALGGRRIGLMGGYAFAKGWLEA